MKQALSDFFVSRTSDLFCRGIVQLDAHRQKVLDADADILRINGISKFLYTFVFNKSKTARTFWLPCMHLSDSFLDVQSSKFVISSIAITF